MRFWVVFRSEWAVLTIFPPYIIPNGTYERKKKLRYPPFNVRIILIDNEEVDDDDDDDELQPTTPKREGKEYKM